MDRSGYLHGSKEEIIALQIYGNDLLYHSYQMLLYNKNSIYILELQNKMTVTVIQVTVFITQLYYNSYRHPAHFSTLSYRFHYGSYCLSHQNFTELLL